MKLTHTGLPRSDVRSMEFPPSSGSTSGGAGSPTWKRPGIGERGGRVGRGVGDGSDGTASDGSVEGVAEPAGLGDAVELLGLGLDVGRAGVGEPAAEKVANGGSMSGPNVTTAARTITAVRIPASRPMTMAALDDMTGRVPAAPGEGPRMVPMAQGDVETLLVA